MKASVISAILVVSCFGRSSEMPVSTRQVSHGACSPNISNVTGKVTIQFLGDACSGIDPRVIGELNKLLADYPKTVGRLQELLDRKDVELSEKTREIEDWIAKYQKLSKQLAGEPADDQISQRAASLLKEGDLDGASKLLDDIIGRDELRIDQAARDHFNRALAYELQLQPLDALSHYQQAYRYRPEEFAYAFADAELMLNENMYAEAEPIFLAALSDARRDLTKDKTQVHLANLARTSLDLGVLYARTDRTKEAEAMYLGASSAYRRLAKDRPGIYLSYFAGTLGNLGNLYENTQRMKEAETVLTEVIVTYRQSGTGNVSSAYLSCVVAALDNLGVLYQNTQRMDKAESSLTQALAIQRKLAQIRPASFRPALVVRLDDLGKLYRKTNQLQPAENAFREAVAISRELVGEDRSRYLPDLAMTLSNTGNLYNDAGREKEAEETYGEALTYYRELMKLSAAAYISDTVLTLNNLGGIYMKAERYLDAERAYTAALASCRELSNSNPALYSPSVLLVLNNLGKLYSQTERIEDAERAYAESVEGLSQARNR